MCMNICKRMYARFLLAARPEDEATPMLSRQDILPRLCGIAEVGWGVENWLCMTLDAIEGEPEDEAYDSA